MLRFEICSRHQKPTVMGEAMPTIFHGQIQGETFFLVFDSVANFAQQNEVWCLGENLEMS